MTSTLWLRHFAPAAHDGGLLRSTHWYSNGVILRFLSLTEAGPGSGLILPSLCILMLYLGVALAGIKVGWMQTAREITHVFYRGSEAHLNHGFEHARVC